ncbi:MAG: peptidoglycan DD-metalloendopeptidase family protein [Firmicutes bacterium]|nr:peptidoglycan DD-metalloendopeptidase family protein [Bacillota bacterium]
MKKGTRATILCLIAILAITFTSVGLVYGTEITDKLDDVNEQIDEITQQLKKGQAEEKQLANRIKNLEKEIVSAENEIKSLQGQIKDTEVSVKAAQVDLEIAQANLQAAAEDLNEQDYDMSQRIRSMYKSGDMTILEVLLGSANITDFMTNLDMAQRIYENDVAILEDLGIRYEKLEDERNAVEERKNNLAVLKSSLESQYEKEKTDQAALKVSKTQVQDMKAAVADNNDALEEMIDALNEEANALKAEILKLQGNGDYVGGELLWPTSAGTRVSSPFGYRIHPILKTKKLHTGIDIAIGSNSNVRAANTGTVIKAQYSGGYGYMVMIDHGGGIVTLYAHNNKLLVSKGDIVDRGQEIAKSGSTGMSTGPHLHFEVRLNGEYVDPMDYL